GPRTRAPVAANPRDVRQPGTALGMPRSARRAARPNSATRIGVATCVPSTSSVETRELQHRVWRGGREASVDAAPRGRPLRKKDDDGEQAPTVVSIGTRTLAPARSGK